MSESPSPAVPVELVTLDEARELLAARELLKTISSRAGEAAYGLPSGLIFPRPIRAQDCGRLAGVADAAADAIFTAVISAANYCLQTGADRATEEYLVRPRPSEVTP